MSVDMWTLRGRAEGSRQADRCSDTLLQKPFSWFSWFELRMLFKHCWFLNDLSAGTQSSVSSFKVQRRVQHSDHCWSVPVQHSDHCCSGPGPTLGPLLLCSGPTLGPLLISIKWSDNSCWTLVLIHCVMTVTCSVRTTSSLPSAAGDLHPGPSSCIHPRAVTFSRNQDQMDFNWHTICSKSIKPSVCGPQSRIRIAPSFLEQSSLGPAGVRWCRGTSVNVGRRCWWFCWCQWHDVTTQHQSQDVIPVRRWFSSAPAAAFIVY